MCLSLELACDLQSIKYRAGELKQDQKRQYVEHEYFFLKSHFQTHTVPNHQKLDMACSCIVERSIPT